MERDDRYLYNLGKAASICGGGRVEAVMACDSRLVNAEDARSGIGSSELEDCSSNGSNGLYGSSLFVKVSTNVGISSKPRSVSACDRIISFHQCYEDIEALLTVNEITQKY